MNFSNSIMKIVSLNRRNSSHATVYTVTRARGGACPAVNTGVNSRPRPAVEEWGEELCTFLSQISKISLTAPLLLCRDFTFTFKGSILQVRPYSGDPSPLH